MAFGREISNKTNIVIRQQRSQYLWNKKEYIYRIKWTERETIQVLLSHSCSKFNTWGKTWTPIKILNARLRNKIYKSCEGMYLRGHLRDKDMRNDLKIFLIMTEEREIDKFGNLGNTSSQTIVKIRTGK